jgi:hypothetical protein
VVLREEEDKGDGGGTELNAVAGLETGGFATGAVDEDAVAAAQVLDEVTLVVVVDSGMLAGDLRVG